MKKLISFLLALVMLASVLPASLVSAASEYDVKIEFGGTLGHGSQTKPCDLDGTAAGYTVVVAETSTAKGDNRQTTIGNTATIVQQLDMGTGDAWLDRTASPYDSMFTFTVPVTKAGSYSVALLGGKWHPGAEFFIYVNGKYAGYYNFTDSVTTNKKPVANEEKTLNTLWLDAGEAKVSFVLARKTQYYQWGNRALPISLSLNYVGEEKVSYSKFEHTLPTELALGETVSFSAYAVMSDGSQFRANGYEIAASGMPAASTANKVNVSVSSGKSVKVEKTSDDISADGVFEGTVTATSGGKTNITLTAMIDGEAKTVVHTINVDAPESGVGEAADETVSVYVAAENGGNVTSSDIGIGVANTVDTGKEITVSANETENLAFSHWRNASGKFISDEAKYTFEANVNTAIIAVYDRTDDSSEDVSVSFYNQFKGLITSKAVEKGTSFASASDNIDTKLTGHKFASWSIPGETIINSTMRAVAFYEVSDKEYTASFSDGDIVSTQKGKYGDEVKYTATGENFSYWMLSDGSERIISYDKEISFCLWCDISVTAVYDGEKEKLPTIILDEEDGAYFIGYNTPGNYKKVEAGIIFSKSGTPVVNSCYSKAISEKTTPTGQFTVLPSEEEVVARGFLMVEDSDGNKRVIYADIAE